MKDLVTNITLAARAALFIGAMLLLVECGGESLPVQPTPNLDKGTPTSMTESTATQPPDDVGGPRPIPTSDASPGSIPTSGVITGPIVGTSVATGPVEGPPLSSLGTPTPPPTLMPGPDGVLTIKSADRPTEANLSTGDIIKLELEDFYDWEVRVSNPAVLVRESEDTYRAANPGNASLTLDGEPKCFKSTPPCGAPSVSFTVSVTVK